MTGKLVTKSDPVKKCEKWTFWSWHGIPAQTGKIRKLLLTNWQYFSEVFFLKMHWMCRWEKTCLCYKWSRVWFEMYLLGKWAKDENWSLYTIWVNACLHLIFSFFVNTMCVWNYGKNLTSNFDILSSCFSSKIQTDN